MRNVVFDGDYWNGFGRQVLLIHGLVSFLGKEKSAGWIGTGALVAKDDPHAVTHATNLLAIVLST